MAPIMSEILDLIPWETQPELPEEQEAVIGFRGGTLRLPRLGFMTGNEMECIRRPDPQNAMLLAATTSAAARVRAEAESGGAALSPRAAYGLLLKLQAGEFGLAGRLTEIEQDLQVRHAALVSGYLQEVRVIANRVVIASVTAILRRIRPGWTDEQTMRLPGDLISALHAFQQEEEQAGSPPVDQATLLAQLDDALGKLNEAIPSPQTDPAGPPSSGNADASIPALPSSPASGSGTSPAASSSKQSPRGSRQSASGSTAAS